MKWRLSQGELYTVLTSKARHGKHGALVAIVKGTKAEVVNEAVHQIPRARRETVQTPSPTILTRA